MNSKYQVVCRMANAFVLAIAVVLVCGVLPASVKDAKIEYAKFIKKLANNF